MQVRVYSTLTGREEDLAPAAPDGVLRMYVCGMTPKFHPHVGHARVFVATDMIRRYLHYRGYRVKYVQNFTDIDDKIIQRAEREERDAFATAQAYIDSYFAVMDRLNVQRADVYPRVTTYIPAILAFIQGLIDKGHAYAEQGDVYFAVASFPGYGKLSHRDVESQIVAAREGLTMEPGKRSPRDFALWKAAKPGEPAWDSPWGPGRPGWHIECSTMVRETLGEQIDLHGGGADLIFPHHENEIAQSESLTGVVPFARHWVHTGLVTTSGEKMAHSLENFFTIEGVLDRYRPSEVRYYLLATHYRSSLAFMVETEDGQPRVRGIEEARSALERLRRAVGSEPLDPEGPCDQAGEQAFQTAMDDDFNTPVAFSVVFELAHEVNRLRDAGGDPSALDAKRRCIVHLLDVMGIDLGVDVQAGAHPADAFVELLVRLRHELRDAKQWVLADQVRDELAHLGVIVEDKQGGGSDWRWQR